MKSAQQMLRDTRTRNTLASKQHVAANNGRQVHAGGSGWNDQVGKPQARGQRSRDPGREASRGPWSERADDPAAADAGSRS